MNLPSLKLRRTTVVISGADERKEAAQLRARLAELERTPEDIAQAEAERYTAALLEEKRGAQVRLAHAEARDPDEHERIIGPHAPSGYSRAELCWGERAQHARENIEQIDAEIARVTEAGS
jgi:hypothetical protein